MCGTVGETEIGLRRHEDSHHKKKSQKRSAQWIRRKRVAKPGMATKRFQKCSVVDPNTMNLDPYPGFWLNLDPDPDPGLYYK